MTGQAKTVLVACDEKHHEMLTDQMDFILLARNERVIFSFVFDLESAIDQLKEDESISVVITDVSLPTMIGLRLLNAIKKNNIIKDIYVIGVSDCFYWKDRFIKAGADSAYCFAENPEKLLEKVSAVIGEEKS